MENKSSVAAAAALLALLALVGIPGSSCRPPGATIGDGAVTVSCVRDQDCWAALDAGNCDQGSCVICQASSDCLQSSESCVAGTCQVGTGTGGTSGGTSGGSSTGGHPDSGMISGQCVTSCDCTTSSAGPACLSGNCGAKPSPCTRNNDCSCNELCSAGHCEPKCATNTDCKNPFPVCYLPQGQCGPCTKSSDCSGGVSCVGGACQAAPDGGCSSSHCCNDANCPAATPACNATTGVCGACTNSSQCSSGYSCVSGTCQSATGDAGCAPNGCPAGEVCVGNSCVSQKSCKPPCGAPATCDPTNNSCVCPTNCNGICSSGQTCDMTSCQCGVGTGGIGGSLGGFPDGGLGLPSFCAKDCSGCPSGQTCMCPNLVSGAGEVCVTGDVWCSLGGYCQ